MRTTFAETAMLKKLNWFMQLNEQNMHTHQIARLLPHLAHSGKIKRATALLPQHCCNVAQHTNAGGLHRRRPFWAPILFWPMPLQKKVRFVCKPNCKHHCRPHTTRNIQLGMHNDRDRSVADCRGSICVIVHARQAFPHKCFCFHPLSTCEFSAASPGGDSST